MQRVSMAAHLFFGGMYHETVSEQQNGKHKMGITPAVWWKYQTFSVEFQCLCFLDASWFLCCDQTSWTSCRVCIAKVSASGCYEPTILSLHGPCTFLMVILRTLRLMYGKLKILVNSTLRWKTKTKSSKSDKCDMHDLNSSQPKLTSQSSGGCGGMIQCKIVQTKTQFHISSLFTSSFLAIVSSSRPIRR